VLAVGLLGLGLGLAHGACDQLVLPAHRPVRGPWAGYLRRFVLGYSGLAAAAALAWWRWPGAAVGAFFLLSAWHWGSADAPAQPRRALWLAHSLLRGGLLFAAPARWWPAEAQHSVDGLLVLAGAAPLAAGRLAAGAACGWPLVLAGHLALWGGYAARREPHRWRTDAAEVLLLAGLFAGLPPLLALGVYFVFWHSLQHVLRLNRLLGHAAGPAGPWGALGRELKFFLRRARPLLLVSLAALAALYALAGARRLPPDAWAGLALAATAALTLPHALVVSLVMDAPVWRAAPKAGPKPG